VTLPNECLRGTFRPEAGEQSALRLARFLTFALGIFTCRAHTAGTIVGIVTSAAILFLVQNYTRVHFFLYAAVGIITCFVVGYLTSLVIPARRRHDLEGLTIYTLGERRRARAETIVGMIAP